jgi:hypothetical protein
MKTTLRSLLASLLFCLTFSVLNAQNVNFEFYRYAVERTSYGDQSGCPDPAWFASATDNVDGNSTGTGCYAPGDNCSTILYPLNLIRARSGTTASIVYLNIDAWENDCADSDCSYNTGGVECGFGVFSDYRRCNGTVATVAFRSSSYEPYTYHYLATNWCGSYRYYSRHYWSYASAPVITSQPAANTIACAGSAVTLSVDVTRESQGNWPIARHYKWQRADFTQCDPASGAWVDVTGAISNVSTNASTISYTTPTNLTGTYLYRCVLTSNETADFNSLTTISNCARVTWHPIASPPAILSSACGSSVLPGAVVNFAAPLPGTGVASTVAVANASGYTWSNVSGPATPSIASPNGSSTNITFPSTAGTYTIRLTYNDGCAAADATTTCNITVAESQCEYVYVSTSGTDAAGRGGPSNPYRTVAYALANPNGRSHIRLASGTYNESSILNLFSGVTVEGGYEVTGSSWRKNQSVGQSTIINASGSETVNSGGLNYCHVIGFRSLSLSNWTLMDLRLTNSNASGTADSRGCSNYGVLINNSSGYNIIRCAITSGNASAGSDGSAGANGGNGNNGGGGNGGGSSDSNFLSGGGGGGGGTGGSGSNGGNGGGGGSASANGCRNEGADGAGVGGGGGGGQRGLGSGCQGCCSRANGGNANGGGPGNAGSGYSAGSRAGNSSAYNIYFRPSGQGASGNGGTGGGGGGGGGSSSGERRTGFVCASCIQNYGNSGGGGGGGGAGGAGGAGGFGGGSSFAIYANGSGTPSVPSTTLGNGSLGLGGNGGNGGSGGSGGSAGGGNGSNSGDRGTSGSGGNGGAGGAGGRGQDGANGFSGFLAVNGTVSSPGNPSIPQDNVRVEYSNTKPCINSEVTLSSASNFNWGLPSGFSLVNNLGPSSTSYTTSNTSNLVMQTTSTTGAVTFTANGNTYTNAIRISGDARTLPSITAPATICSGGSATLAVTNSWTGSGKAAFEWIISNTNAANTPLLTSGLASPSVNFSSLSPGTYQIRYREQDLCCGWSTPVFSTITINPDPVAQAIAKSPNVTTVCQGQGLSATFSGGSGGAGTITDSYEFSTNGGSSWAAYTAGSTITTASAVGAAAVQVRTWRSATGNDCNTTAYTVASWDVVLQPVAPEINSNISNNNTVCQGQAISATFGAGEGGIGTSDTYEFSTNGGGSWATYTPGNNISTSSLSGSNVVSIRSTRSAGSGTGCSANTVTSQWSVVAQPVSGVISPNVANGSTVCQGQSISATIAAGSGGFNSTNVSRFTTDGGTSWSTYTSGSSISTSSLSGSSVVQIRSIRTRGDGDGCNGDSVTLSWSVVPQPVAGVITPNIASGNTVCQGQDLSATIGAGSGGTGSVDIFEFSTNGGSSWSAYTSGTTINTNSLNGTDVVRIRTTRTVGTGTSCTEASNLVQWSVVTQPVAAALTPNIASGNTVCQGQSLSASFTSGSGGSGSTDLIEVSTNGGSSWSVYTSGSAINTASLTGNNIVQVRSNRTVGTGDGCSAASEVKVQWSVVTQPVAAALTPNIASGETVCQGQSLSATFTNGSGGTGSTDVVEVSTNGGSSWSAYTSGSAINTASLSGNNIVRIRSNRTVGTGDGCAAATEVVVQWSVATPAVAQTFTSNVPSGTTICQGQDIIATQLVAGSGGGGVVVDELEFTLDSGSTWSPYTFGTPINTTTANGANMVRIRTRRTTTGANCVTTGYNTQQWSVVAQPLAIAFIPNIPSGTSVCRGQLISATFTPNSGSGGVGSSDVVEYSINGGTTWFPYSSGLAVNTSTVGAANVLQIRSRRNAGSATGCVSAINLLSWPVTPQAVAQTLSPNVPNNSVVSAGQNLSASLLSAGSGGGSGFVDELEVSTDGGVNWSPYSFGTPISTVGLNGVNVVIIRTRRTTTASNCTNSAYITVQWSVGQPAVAGTIVSSEPASSTVCRGQSISATFTAGSGGGTGSMDQYEFSTNAGTSWSTYTPGNAIATTTLNGTNVVQIRIRRTAGSGSGFTPATNTASWSVVPVPVAQTLTPNVANGTTVCQGQDLSATQLAAGSHGAGTILDELEFTTDAGSSWNAYTFGTPISTNGLTGTNVVRIRTRRTATGSGCTSSAYNTLQWSVNLPPTAATFTPNVPSGTTVCRGQSISATFTAGSGGSGAADVVQFSVNGGTTWGNYPSGTVIGTPTLSGTDVVQIRARRTVTAGTGCTEAVNLLTWSVVLQPVAQTLTPNVTSGLTVCQGQDLSAIQNAAGSGGTGTVADELEFSTNAGSTWSAYTFGNAISTTGLTGTNLVRIRTRRTATGSACASSAYSTLQWSVVAPPVAPTLTSAISSGTSVCGGQNLSATFTPGSGGVASADVVEFSINGGTTWNPYASGSVINTTLLAGTDVVQVRSRRSAGTATGCNSASNLITWSVVSAPIAQTLNPSVASGTSICSGQSLSATQLAPASGGTGTVTDELEFSTDAGATWAPYTFGTPISTSGLSGTNLVRIRTRRTTTSANCPSTAYNTVQWTVSQTPVAATITPSIANGSTVCRGQNLSATFGAGSGGGTGAVDQFEFSNNGGTSWAAYTPGSSISTAGLNGVNVIQVRSRRTVNTGSACSPAINSVAWSVVPQPVAQTMTPNVASGATVCQGQDLSATLLVAASGGTGTVSDELEFTTDGGTTWIAYTFGIPISTSGLTGTNVVRIRTRRLSTGTNCSATSYNTLQWSVVEVPVAPVLTPNVPNGATVCRGQVISATFTSGIGGAGGADVIQSSVNGGLTWSVYTSGQSIGTPTLSGANVVQIRARRTVTAGNGCVEAVNLLTWSVVPQPVAQTLTPNVPSGNTVCQGQDLSATQNVAGSGGDASSTDELEFSTDAGASWSPYTFGTSINTSTLTGTNVVRIRTRRVSTASACVNTVYNTLQWSVTPQITAPTLTPNVANSSTVCSGQSLSAVVTPGSGGVGSSDVIEVSTNGGVSWSNYVSNAPINTSTLAGATVQIRANRTTGTAGSCVSTTNTVTWTVVAQPSAPALVPNVPSGTTVCADQDIIATVTAGSGGIGSTDIVEFSVDGGNNWFTYVSDGGISTSTLLGTNIVQVRSSRDAGTAIGCSASMTTLSWSVVPQPVSPIISPNIADGSVVCAGTILSASIAGGSGGSGTSADVVEYSMDGGNTWLAYTSGTSIATTSLSGTDVVQVRTSRTSTGASCVTSAYNLVKWSVKPLPAATTVAAPAEICAGQSTSFTPDPISGVSFTYWDAAIGGNQLGLGSSFTTPALSGNTTYYVESVLNDCPSATRTAVVVTVPTPNATVTPNFTTISAGNSITYTHTGTARPSATFQWTFPGGTPSSLTGPGPHVISYATVGTYTNTLTINDGPCTDTKTNQVNVTFSCSTPNITLADQITSVSARLNWPSVANAAYFNIRYRVNGTTLPFSVVTAPNGGGATSGYVSLLQANTTYQVVLQAFCVVGAVPAPSDTFYFSTNGQPQPCPSPSITSASQITSTSMQVNWTPVAGAVSYQVLYRVQGATTSAFTIVTAPGGATATSVVVSPLVDNTTYEFYLRSYCAVDLPMPLSPVFTATTLSGAPSCTSPSINSIDQITSTSMRVNWTPGANIVSYQILYKVQGAGNPVNTFNVSGNGSVSSATISPLVASTTYDVQIRAFCTGNLATTPSAVTSATTTNVASVCSTPVINSADQITSVSMRLNWTPNPLATFYAISYRLTGSTAALTTVTVSGNGTASSFIISPLNPNSQYDVYLRAFCNGGVAQPLSPVFNASTNSVVGPCVTPNISSVDQITSASMRVNWVANPNISYYQLFFRVSGSLSAFTAVSVPGGATATSCYLSPLSPNTAYEIQLRAFCTGNLQMPNSPSFIASTNLAAAACPVPVVGSVTNVTTTAATINWTTVANAQSYQLYYRVSGVGSYLVVNITPGTASSRVLTGLTLNTAYQFYMRATCASSLFSANSNVSTFTTASSMPSAPDLGTLKNGEEDLATDLTATVYPNPSREGKFTLRVNGVAEKDLQISMTDLLGREILTEQAYSADAEFNRDFDMNLSNGTYILRVVVEGKQLLTRVVVFR